MTTFVRAMVIAGSMLAVGGLVQAAPLFRPVPMVTAADQGKDPKVRRSQVVAVRFEALDGDARVPGASAASELDLDLFGTPRTAVLDRTENTSGGYAWVGRLRDVPDSTVVLAVDSRSGLMSGSISSPQGVFSIRYHAPGLHVLQEMDHSAFPGDIVREPESDGGAAMEDVPVTAERDDGTQVDILVVYTPAARTAAGGTTAIGNLIDLAITETNNSYLNSGVAHRVRLVHKAETAYTEAASDAFSVALDALTATNDGFMDEVHTLRNTYGADQVSLIINSSTSCGIAWVMSTPSTSFASNAFSVTARECATGYYSFGHELGHNMSARHDWFVDTVNNSPFSYNHGYFSPTNAWRDVMSYANGCPGSCPRIPYWSNPTVTYTNGQVMGIAEGQFQAADNRRTLNNTSWIASNWRASAVSGARIADVNGDSRSDVVWRHSNGSNYVWLLTSGGTTPTSLPAVSDSNWKIQGRGDYNANGKADLLWHNSATGEVYVWLMNGASISSAAPVATITDLGWQIAGSRDHDGDGKSDVLWRHQTTGEVYLWLMNGTSYVGRAVERVSDTGWRIVGTGDYNGDRKADILWRHTTTGQVYLWLMNGSTVSSKAALTTVSDANWTVVGQGDFSGDGRSDVLWRHATTGQVYLWTMNGATILWTGALGTVADTNWKIVDWGDYNGDSFHDILWHHATTGQVYRWQANGATGGYTGSVLGTVSDLGWKIASTR